MCWVLVFTIASNGGGTSGVHFFWLPVEAKCGKTACPIGPLQRELSAVCIGPDGQVLDWE